jgi:hypothetical protein
MEMYFLDEDIDSDMWEESALVLANADFILWGGKMAGQKFTLTFDANLNVS